MIGRGNINKLITSLKPYTRTSIYENQKEKYPIIFSGNNEVNESIQHSSDGTNINPDTIYNSNIKIKKCKITNQWMFHYNSKWYVNKCSAEEPQYNFGILKVDQEIIPWKNLELRRDKHSFIARMDRLIYQNEVVPFLVFVNRKFVNWNYIDIVSDNDDVYILLHGDKYNYYNLSKSEFHIMILPFNIQFVGNENNDSFNTYYNMLSGFLQKSIHTDSAGNPRINVPTMDGEYEYRGMVYNVGAWLYTQIRNYKLGILSEERINKMMNIYTYHYVYDIAGNIISEKQLRFNAFDLDSYDKKLADEISSISYSYLSSNYLFRFDNDGNFDTTGSDIISLIEPLDSTYKFYKVFTSEEYPTNNSLFFEPDEIRYPMKSYMFVCFSDGQLLPEFDIIINDFNCCEFTQTSQKYDIIGLYKSEYVDEKYRTKEYDIKVSRNINNTSYYINNYSFNDEYNDGLDYEFLNTLSYDENLDNAYSKLLEFDNAIFKDLYKSYIKSSSISGDTANAYINTFNEKYNRMALPIPRQKYEDHETYVIIFKNGEIIDNYNELIVYPNMFLLPIDNLFSSSDSIEYLYFTNIDNNEIHFRYSDYIDDNKISKEIVDGHYRKIDIFSEYINKEDLKIFCSFPVRMIKYAPLVVQDDSISFNVSCRDEAGDLYIDIDSLPYEIIDEIAYTFLDESHLLVQNTEENISALENENIPYELIDASSWILIDADNIIDVSSISFTAVSEKKFIYQRLEVNHRSYRIKLDQRFRYCDNQKQYELFINGRRMENDSFIITIPKNTRPFWGMYLYTAKFVTPQDRIDLFYLPEELNNINTSNAELPSDGYITVDKTSLDVPFWNNMYMMFVNGKKIEQNDLINIDSNTLKVAKDTFTTKNLVINPIYTDYIEDISTNLKDDSFITKYDKMISEIRNTKGIVGLNNLFNNFISIYDIEPDKLLWNVGRIALINEIIRNFWVRSGWDYTEKFIYDFLIETEYFKYDTEHEYYDTSAMDANEYINIIKNFPHIMSFTMNPPETLYEYGSTIPPIILNWEFSENFYDELNIVWQKINDIDIDTSRRSYTLRDLGSSDTTIKFAASTGFEVLNVDKEIKFANAIYYGNIDEDLLQDYFDPDAERTDTDTVPYTKDDLDIICNQLSKDLSLDLDYTLNHVIGNNNYLVIAIPKRLCFKGKKSVVGYIMPDPESDDVKAHCRDDKTTPIYTDGKFNKDHTLHRLRVMEMQYMGEFSHTNAYGFTEDYMMWKTNGFFTRLFDDYVFTIKIYDITKAEIDE